MVAAPRFAYAGREDCPAGVGDAASTTVEFEVELVDFEREGHWQVRRGRDCGCGSGEDSWPCLKPHFPSSIGTKLARPSALPCIALPRTCRLRRATHWQSGSSPRAMTCSNGGSTNSREPGVRQGCGSSNPGALQEEAFCGKGGFAFLPPICGIADQTPVRDSNPNTAADTSGCCGCWTPLGTSRRRRRWPRLTGTRCVMWP